MKGFGSLEQKGIDMLMNKPARQKGFTLIELLVTVAVLAIIATLATPSFSAMLAKQRLNSTVKDLTNSLSKARSQAALLRKEVVVSLNSTQTIDTQTTFNWKPIDASIRTSSGTSSLDYKNIKLVSSTSSITFTSSGTVKDGTAAGTDFVICNKAIGLSKNINLSSMGIVSYQADGASCTW